MKDKLLELLERRLPLPGVAAWGIRRADRSVQSHCYGDWFSPPQIEQALGLLALAADGLGYHGIQPLRLCWVFEHSRIHLALRRDGVCLALFAENRAGLANEKLEAVLAEFAAMSVS
jgi:hypothetical protein